MGTIFGRKEETRQERKRERPRSLPLEKTHMIEHFGKDTNREEKTQTVDFSYPFLKVFGGFAVARPPTPEKHPKSVPMGPPRHQKPHPKVTQELPRETLERPGEAPKASQVDPRTSWRPLGMASGASGPHFGGSEAHFSILLGPPSDPATHPSPVFSARASLSSSLSFLGSGT